MCLSEEQLRAAAACVVKRLYPKGVNHTVNSSYNYTAYRVLKAFWRGSANGFTRGWTPKVSRDKNSTRNPIVWQLLNKRTYMAMMSRPYPWLDIALSGWAPSLNENVTKALTKSALDLDDWARYVLTISIDGFGAPWRLGSQLLGMTVVARMESPYKTWLDPYLKPGIHYEPVQHDLRDFVGRTQDLVREAERDSHRLQRMAEAARDLVATQANGIAQLDTFMASVLAVKRICAWEVQAPSSSKGGSHKWEVLQLPRHNNGGTMGLSHLKDRTCIITLPPLLQPPLPPPTPLHLPLHPHPPPSLSVLAAAQQAALPADLGKGPLQRVVWPARRQLQAVVDKSSVRSPVHGMRFECNKSRTAIITTWKGKQITYPLFVHIANLSKPDLKSMDALRQPVSMRLRTSLQLFSYQGPSPPVNSSSSINSSSRVRQRLPQQWKRTTSLQILTSSSSSSRGP
ncbi:hypothetical protein QJQ45_023356 [Haematococcus lacustris]|nr:hypothetical protein QJQ45_023356 [Haematococcus lacustris]